MNEAARKLSMRGPLSRLDLAGLHWNLGPAALLSRAVRDGEGVLTDAGALAVETGKFTGRSPQVSSAMGGGGAKTAVGVGSAEGGLGSSESEAADFSGSDAMRGDQDSDGYGVHGSEG